MKKIIKFILFLVILVGVCLVVGSVYLKKTYGVDVILTYKQVKKLNENVDENTLCDNKFTQEDKESCKDILNNATASDLIKNQGSDFIVDYDALKSNIKEMIKLTDKECAAMADSALKEKYNGVLEFGNISFPTEVLQIKFSNIVDDGSADINLVAKIDFKSLKESLNQFPMSLFDKYIPDVLYVSSTNYVKKGTEAFEYTIESKEFLLNNLTSDEAATLFNTINNFVKIGQAEDFNLQIGNIICNALIGNVDNEGLAYSLKDYGAKDFKFIKEEDNSYFVIERKTLII